MSFPIPYRSVYLALLIAYHTALLPELGGVTPPQSWPHPAGSAGDSNDQPVPTLCPCTRSPGSAWRLGEGRLGWRGRGDGVRSFLCISSLSENQQKAVYLCGQHGSMCVSVEHLNMAGEHSGVLSVKNTLDFKGLV